MDFGRRLGASDEHIPQWICKEQATTPPAKRHAALRVAPNLAPWLRCSVGRVSLRIHSFPRASPRAKLGATKRVRIYEIDHLGKANRCQRRRFGGKLSLPP